MQHVFDTYVLGGLPVEITFTHCPAEPDVGIFDSYIDEWYISGLNGRTLKNYDWIYNRLSSRDEDKIVLACHDSLN